MNPVCMYAAGMWGVVTILEASNGRGLRALGAGTFSVFLVVLAFA